MGIYQRRTVAELLATGIPAKFVVDRDTHPGHCESSWPLTTLDEKVTGKYGLSHQPHIKPMSVMIAPIGNMWEPNGHWRVQNMVKAMESRGYVDRVVLQEMNDTSPAPGVGVSAMRSSAAMLALDGGIEWVFLMNNDAMVEEDTLERLLAWDRPVVSAYLIDTDRKSLLMGPELKQNIGLQPVAWAAFDAMLFNARVFNAIGLNPWEYGASEYHFAQKLNHVGHRIYVDTNAPVNVVTAPGRWRSKGWDEYWAGQRELFERGREEERDRGAPPGFDPVFSDGDISVNGAYTPLGSPYRKRAVNL